MFRKMIERTYAETVSRARIPDELRSALKSSERVPQFITRMSDALYGINQKRLIEGKRPVKPETIKETIRDMTLVFLDGLQKEANHRIASDIEKSKQKAKADYQKDLEASSDGQFVGAFEELKEGMADHSVEVNNG